MALKQYLCNTRKGDFKQIQRRAFSVLQEHFGDIVIYHHFEFFQSIWSPPAPGFSNLIFFFSEDCKKYNKSVLFLNEIK